MQTEDARTLRCRRRIEDEFARPVRIGRIGPVRALHERDTVARGPERRFIRLGVKRVHMTDLVFGGDRECRRRDGEKC